MTARPILTGLESQAQGAREVLAAYAATDIDTRFLRSPKFIDYSRKDYLLQRGRRTYVNPLWDARDGFLMTEWERSVKRSKGFGRGYQRRQFERAFYGCRAAAIDTSR